MAALVPGAKLIRVGPPQKIEAAGVYDMPMPWYHDDCCVGPSISSGGLRTIWSYSPAHYWAESRLNPDNWEDRTDEDGVVTRVFLPEEDDERPHFSLGRAAHHLLFLGRDKFLDEFAIRPPQWKDWRTKEAQKWKREARAAGYTIITENELENITGMAKSLAVHPLVRAGILDGEVERSLIWRDPETGIWLKSRPDNLPATSSDGADLKTTTSVRTDSLQRTLAEFQYAMQADLARQGFKAVLGRDMESFAFVFVETKKPWCVRVVSLRPSDLERAAIQNRHALRMFAESVATGVWPGPGGIQTDAEYLSPAPWGIVRDENRIALLDSGGSGETDDTLSKVAEMANDYDFEGDDE